MNPNTLIKDLLEKGDYDKIFDIICNSEKLEDLKSLSIMTKILTGFHNKLQYEKITAILLILSKYKKDIFQYEIREGIKFLISHL